MRAETPSSCSLCPTPGHRAEGHSFPQTILCMWSAVWPQGEARWCPQDQLAITSLSHPQMCPLPPPSPPVAKVLWGPARLGYPGGSWSRCLWADQQVPDGCIQGHQGLGRAGGCQGMAWVKAGRPGVLGAWRLAAWHQGVLPGELTSGRKPTQATSIAPGVTHLLSLCASKARLPCDLQA